MFQKIIYFLLLPVSIFICIISLLTCCASAAVLLSYKHFKNKTIILDVKILLNNSLKPGESYIDVIPVHHIGILDFSSHRLPTEFYAHYYLMNGKTYEIYSDRLCLSVLNLSHIQLATVEDKLFRLDQWAALFKAETWEDIKMLTNKNPDFESIADAVYFLTENRELIDAYQDYEARQAYYRQQEKLIQEQSHALHEKDLTIQEQAARIAELEKALAEKR